MNCAGTAAGVRFPWNRVAQRVIDFENAGSVSKRFQSVPVHVGQLPASNTQEFPYRNVQENDARCWQVVQIFNATVDLDTSVEFAQIIGERRRNQLRAAACSSP